MRRYQLANGLKVVLAPDPSFEDVSVITHYNVGSADDPYSKDGLAHLVEHLMFSLGSKHVAPGEYHRRISSAGGVNANAVTTLDSTYYFVTVAPANLAVVLWLESDRMGFVADRVSELAVATEKRLIADELRDRLFDQNLGMIGPAGFMQLFPADHPYHRQQSYFGLAGCTVDDVRAFLRTWYNPSNTTIAVAGRFDVANAQSLIDRYFGDLPAAASPARPELPSHWRVHDARIFAGANVPHDVVNFMWTAPAVDQPGDAALDLAAAILADPDGRLQRDLVGTGLAVSVSARESSWQRTSVFWITAVVEDGKADEAVTRIDQVISDLATVVRPEEYKRARDEWFDSMLLRLETSLGRAFMAVRKGAPDIPWDLDKYDHIGPIEVASAVRYNLVPDNRVVVIVHHDRRYPAQGAVFLRKERLP